MKYGIFTTSALALLAFLPSGARAGSIELPSLPPTEVYITNNSSSTTLNFRIAGNACSGVLDVSLLPDRYGTYKCNGASAFSFTITTNMSDGSNITRTANLTPTKRYEIYAESSGVWNIKEIYSR